MKKIIFVLTLCFITLLTGCMFDSSDSAIDKVETNQRKLESIVDLPVLNNSLERINIKKRLELFNDENKISYIYLINFGKIISFNVVKGKVTSSHKRLTQNDKIEYGDYSYKSIISMEAPSLDGSYGDSDEYIFFWDTDGRYYQWSGDYLLVDQPLKLSTPPELVRNVK